ncbi:Mor transcription activator family protein [Burkholderia perseverans]|uniref:Mor transcription activator family protein n=1 Tax=Burkholderia perseverans TaxID=2615214 RepID=UPI001FEFBB92|nr:Mor transcription activator family protein [Burkholderia perseverans]
MDLIEVQHMLPKSIRTIMALIGPDATRKLIETMAGVSVLVPKGRNAFGRAKFEAIAECIGQEAAEKLSKYFGGEVIEVATCHHALVELRRRQLREEFTALCREYSTRQALNILARTHGMSGRHIRLIVNLPDERPAADTQLSLL